MLIQQLFDAYQRFFPKSLATDSLFLEAGMVNRFAELDFGFFPLGPGLLANEVTLKTAKIMDCRILVLGNDFGTVSYIEKKCPYRREKYNNPTIKNLRLLGLNENTTLFSNLFMGLRTTGGNTDPKFVPPAYRTACLEFYREQLKILQPRIVICLGKQVLEALVYFDKIFQPYTVKPISYLFQNDNSDFVINCSGIKYLIMPHPSYAHINWSKYRVAEQVREELSKS